MRDYFCNFPSYLSMKKVFFCSDFHFGIDGIESSKERENLFLKWLKENSEEMEALYVVGDLFDFWFEYKRVVPKGGIRVLAALAALNENGVPVHLFTGNHDQWMFDYFTEELGIPLYHDPVTKIIHGKKVFIGHGDGLGPGDHGYKFIKKVFRNRISRSLFNAIPPGIGIPIAKYWSGASRQKGVRENSFLGEENEWLIQYCKDLMAHDAHPPDLFVFGHRHLPIDWKFDNGARYINLGDWIQYHSYAVLDNTAIKLEFYHGTLREPISNHLKI